MGDIHLIDLFKESILKNWDLPAFSDYGTGRPPIAYKDLSLRIAALHELFMQCGIGKGSKISVLGKNSGNWATAYLSVVLYGCVVVPILPEFKPDEIHHIIDHSDTVLLFCADDILNNLAVSRMDKVRLVLSLSDFRILARSGEKDIEDPSGIHSLKMENAPDPVHLFRHCPAPQENSDEALVSLAYTSGTMGFSKGVMLPQRSLKENILYARENMPLKSGDTILSFLPMAHAFGCAFEFLFPFSVGCHITFLDRTPSPTILLKAFAEIKPRLILSVPLIIEKLYHNRIKKLLEGRIGALYHLPLISRIIKRVIRKKLERVFGGNFIQIIVGGAPLSPEVEAFLNDIRFRYMVGYGMTECGPLICYSDWKTFRKHSVGRRVNPIEIKITSADPAKEPGEIMVRGPNVMQGYYKNEQESAASLTEDGWLMTGDLGTVDASGNIFIRGRKKTMLLGPSGQNIYPEEIEARLNAMPLIRESLVVQRNNRLTALVFLEVDDIARNKICYEDLISVMERNKKDLNSAGSFHCSIAGIEIMKEEFEKTPSRKIKRFLYS